MARLRDVRDQLGWKKARAMRDFRAAATRRRQQIPAEAALARMWAYWENGGRRVSDPLYQEIFCEIYGKTPDQLGFVEDEAPSLGIPDLGDRLRVASVDSSTVELLEAQTQLYRQLDRQLGKPACYRRPRATWRSSKTSCGTRCRVPGGRA